MSRTGKEQPLDYGIDKAAPTADEREEAVRQALDLLIDGELKLLAIYDARQASADTRTAALATAAVALPPLILSLSKAFGSNAGLLRGGYLVVVIAAIFIMAARAWSAWRPRPKARTKVKPRAAGADVSETPAGAQDKHTWPHVSAEGPLVADARAKWRQYQEITQVGAADPVRARQLALEMWRTRADDSRRVAEIKDIMSVAAAFLLALALVITGILVASARFT